MSKDLNDQLQAGELVDDLTKGATVMASDVPRTFTVSDLLTDSYERARAPRSQLACTTGHYAIDRATGGFEKGSVWAFGAETNWGKCLGPDVRVLKADGSACAARQVRQGDLLMGPDSEPRTVLGTTSGHGPMFRIVPRRGEPWSCNWAHILTLVSTRTGKTIEISVEDFMAKSATFRRQHKLFHVGVEYPNHEPISVDPWFVGVWYGDGTKDLTTVSVTTEDPEVSESLAMVADSWGLHLRCDRKPGNSAAAYSLAGTRQQAGGRGNPLIRAMRKVYGDGSGLPLAYTHGTRQTRLEFLAGLIDSDGFKHGDRVCEIVTKNDLWAKQLRLLCRSLGLQANVYRKTNIPGYEDRVYWRVQISGDLSVVPTRIARKKFPASPDHRRSGRRVGFKIEPMGDGDFCGWELDRDGLFLLADFTVTHNSSWLVMVTDENIRAGRRVLIVSAEDDQKLYGDRLMLRRARVSAERFKAKQLQADERQRMHEVAAAGEYQPVFFDARGRSVEWVASRTKQLVKEYGIDLVAFDYLQAFDSDKRHQDRRNQISYTARTLTDVPKLANISGIIFSQITVVEGKPYPDKNSIKESKDVGNAAEIVVMGFTAAKSIVRKDGTPLVEAGERALNLDKNKSGPKGMFPVKWDTHSACFDITLDPEAQRYQEITGGQFDDFGDAPDPRYPD